MNALNCDVSALPQAITIGRRTETGVLYENNNKLANEE